MSAPRSDDAVTTLVLFSVAVAIVMVSIFAVFQATLNVAPPNTVAEVEQINYQSEAATLLDLLIQSPGVLSDGGAWDEETTPSADDLIRLGLLDPATGTLQKAKIDNLREAPFEADGADDFANYEEVRDALGLEEKGLDFHIRTKPTLKSITTVLSNPDFREPNLKVTYIGRVDEANGGGIPLDDGLVIDNLTCAASPTGSPSWRYSVDITNGGTLPTQFLVAFDIDGGNRVERQDQTAVLAANETSTLSVDVENIAGFTCDAANTIGITVADPVQVIHTDTLTSPTVLSTPAAATEEWFAQLNEPNFILLDDVELEYFGDYSVGDFVSLAVRAGTDPSNPAVYVDSHNIPVNPNNRDFTAPGAVFSVGDYTAYITNWNSGIIATQHFAISLTDVNPYTPSGSSGASSFDPDESTVQEVQMLVDLVKQFCPTYYDNDTDAPISVNWTDACGDYKDPAPGNAQPGDVFPDITGNLRDIEDRLLHVNGTPRYDITTTLIVGSNVAHAAMNPAPIKGSIEDWVVGGGTLVVLGSPNSSMSWLQAIFNVGTESSSGGISAPDTTHPLLSTPETLAFDDYETSSKGFKFSGPTEDYFTVVVDEGGTPVTAVSDPGSFGDGTIILSSWQTHDLFGDGSGTSGEEGQRVMYNFMVHSYRGLFIDYGPEVPDDVTVLPATGRALIHHDDLGPVTMDFTIYVFPYGTA